ncbi:MAG: PQQ-binding-like beta-propeller repeat protein [Acidimicrobiales bacterium]|nr:PQQ-binding-like beta-propeller repeat protein [Acidimicrobiales bacterium]
MPVHQRKLGFVLAAFALLASSCWTSLGWNEHNSRANGFESTISPANVATLTEAWRYDGVDGVTSTPIAFGDKVFFGSWDGYLRSVDLADGQLNWQTLLTTGAGAGVMVDATPTIYGNSVFIGDGQGDFHSVNRTTGAVQWSVSLDAHPFARIFGSPVVIDDRIIIGVASYELAVPLPDYTFRGSVVALDRSTGAELWRTYMTENDATAGAGVSVWSTAAVDRSRGLIFIGTGNTYEEPAAPLSDALLAIDYATGSIEWSRQFTEGDVYTIFGTPPQGPDADIGAAPNLFTIGGQDVVGVGDKAGVYAVLDRDTGDTVWARELAPGSPLGGVMTTSVYVDGVIYVSTNQMVDPYNFTSSVNTSLTSALDASDGSILWQTTMPASSFGALSYANGVLFQPTTPGDLYAIDADDGSILWSDDLGADVGGGVSISDGTVLAPYGFWFFTSPPNPVGGVVAYRPA